MDIFTQRAISQSYNPEFGPRHILGDLDLTINDISRMLTPEEHTPQNMEKSLADAKKAVGRAQQILKDTVEYMEGMIRQQQKNPFSALCEDVVALAWPTSIRTSRYIYFLSETSLSYTTTKPSSCFLFSPPQ
jgi:hypothetical protein